MIEKPKTFAHGPSVVVVLDSDGLDHEAGRDQLQY